MPVNYPAPLPAAEQVELCVRAQAGDKAARDRLVLTTMRLVVKRARKWSGGVEIEDLVAEGVFGVMRAIEMFDASRGLRFVTYAQNWIDGHIRRAVVVERYGTEQIENSAQAVRDYYELVADVGHDAALIAAAKKHGQRPETLLARIDARRRGTPLSFDAPATDDGTGSLYDVITRDVEAEDSTLADLDRERVRAAIERALTGFSDREQDIIRRRFLDDEATLEDVGTKWDVSRERVRQIETKIKSRFESAVRRELGAGGCYAEARTEPSILDPVVMPTTRTTLSLTELRRRKAAFLSGQLVEPKPQPKAIREARRRRTSEWLAGRREPPADAPKLVLLPPPTPTPPAAEPAMPATTAELPRCAFQLCGKSFDPAISGQERYCSNVCARDDSEKRWEGYSAHPSQSSGAAQESEQLEPSPGRFKCEVCEQRFDVPGHRGPDPETCSPKCRAVADQRKRPAEQPKRAYGNCALKDCSRPLGKLGKYKPYCSGRCQREGEFEQRLIESGWKPGTPIPDSAKKEPMAKPQTTTKPPSGKPTSGKATPTAEERIKSTFNRARERNKIRQQIWDLLEGRDLDEVLQMLADIMVELESQADAEATG